MLQEFSFFSFLFFPKHITQEKNTFNFVAILEFYFYSVLF